jgi:hypothetical protein
VTRSTAEPPSGLRRQRLRRGQGCALNNHHLRRTTAVMTHPSAMAEGPDCPLSGDRPFCPAAYCALTSTGGEPCQATWVAAPLLNLIPRENSPSNEAFLGRSSTPRLHRGSRLLCARAWGRHSEASQDIVRGEHRTILRPAAVQASPNFGGGRRESSPRRAEFVSAADARSAEKNFAILRAQIPVTGAIPS